MSRYAIQNLENTRNWKILTDILTGNIPDDGNQPRGMSSSARYAAEALGRLKFPESIPALIQALSDRRLYVRLAASDALVKIGKPAVSYLIKNLGEIGGNRHHELPEKRFRKWSYPLIRDLAGRVLSRMGAVPLPDLAAFIRSGFQEGHLSDKILLALEVLGSLVQHEPKPEYLELILEALKKEGNNPFAVWMIVRAFSGFRGFQAPEDLFGYLEQYPEPVVRWESARSLACIGIPQEKILSVLEKSTKDPHPEVKMMAVEALEYLKKKE